MSLQSSLEEIHKNVVSNSWLKLLIAITRGWLAVGFIVPGLKKAVNEPFAAGIPTTEPIGYFFDAFFQATEFYIFVGLAQMLAGALLLFRSTTALGTMIYLPIMFNITFITLALEFKGTWVITILMLLANLFLLCWEFDKWQALIPGFTKSTTKVVERHLSFGQTIIASVLSGLCLMGIGFTVLGLISGNDILYPVLLALISLVASGFMLVRYRSKYILN